MGQEGDPDGGGDRGAVGLWVGRGRGGGIRSRVLGTGWNTASLGSLSLLCKTPPFRDGVRGA